MSKPSKSKIGHESVPAVIPVIEEVAYLGKELVESGRVRVSKRVGEREELIDVPLRHEEITVERVSKGEQVASAPEIRQEGDVTIYPVLREEVVVEKRLILVEELHVRKKVVKTRHTESITLRSEEVEVKRVAES
jgi:uncharacterized protein (TIGR02271 family)